MTPNSSAAELSTRLSAFGIGGIVTPNDSLNWVQQRDFYQILDQATDRLGVSYIDSARAYELSEESIGAWLKTKSLTYKRELVIGSKCSITKFTSSEGVTPHILAEIDASLSAMGVESLDVYWLHAPNRAVPFDVVVEAFDRAIRAGKIRSYGISNVSEPELKTILQISQKNQWAPPAAVQNEYNLLTAKKEKSMTELCARNGILYFAYSPLASGLLSGKYSNINDRPEGARWTLWENSRGLPPYWNEQTFASIEKLKQLATELRVTPAALALAWCLRSRDVSVTLLGPRRPEHLEAAKQALSLKLKSSHISVLDSF